MWGSEENNRKGLYLTHGPRGPLPRCTLICALGGLVPEGPDDLCLPFPSLDPALNSWMGGSPCAPDPLHSSTILLLMAEA